MASVSGCHFKYRFNQISAQMGRDVANDRKSGTTPVVELKCVDGQWQILRTGIDSEYQRFVIKIPSASGEQIDYFEFLAGQFKNDEDGNAKLKKEIIFTALKASHIFNEAKKELGSSHTTGTIKLGFNGEIRKESFEATSINIDMQSSKKAFRAGEKTSKLQDIRSCAKDIFGPRRVEDALDRDDDASDADDAAASSSGLITGGDTTHHPVDPPASPTSDEDADEDDSLPPTPRFGLSVIPEDSDGSLGVRPIDPRRDVRFDRVSSETIESLSLRLRRVSDIDSRKWHEYKGAITSLDCVIRELNKFDRKRLSQKRGHEVRDLAKDQVDYLSLLDTPFSIECPKLRGQSELDKKYDFLIRLFGVTDKKGAEEVLKGLNDGDMWYRFQLALLRAAHDLAIHENNMLVAYKISKYLESTSQTSEYPDFFYETRSRETSDRGQELFLTNRLRSKNDLAEKYKDAFGLVSLIRIQHINASRYREILIKYLSNDPIKLKTTISDSRRLGLKIKLTPLVAGVEARGSPVKTGRFVRRPRFSVA